jgi:hypothetical protein
MTRAGVAVKSTGRCVAERSFQVEHPFTCGDGRDVTRPGPVGVLAAAPT